MPLSNGARVGPYEISGILGAGGMGEVYQARDTKLNRTVALKILPAAFANDPDRLARFKREAQVLASLNHPNIASIYGLEDQGETLALVMELVPGKTLADLDKAPMPVADALPIARQIATALEAAHEQGVVHRDLKPANVKITDDGMVKVLDFGLAKALVAPGSQDPGLHPPGLAGIDAANSPTLTSPAMTELGMILGTAGYMAPEQAKGKPVDRRADIWAFGVVLFELLAGKPLFRGETVTETIAHVITQPPAWDALPASTPASVRRLLRRCLEKDPRNRMQSAGDVRIEIDECISGSAPGADSYSPGSKDPGLGTALRIIPWTIAAALLAALAYTLWPRAAVEPARPLKLEVRLTAGEALRVDPDNDGSIVVLSPDGHALAYIVDSPGAGQLFMRPLDRLEAAPIPGTEGAAQHFFSPDGRYIAFFASGTLKRIPAAGGAPVPIATAVAPRGGAWGVDDTIVFTANTTTGLSRVSASGGTPTVLTKLEPNERTHRWPSFLPGGNAVLFMCQLEIGSYDDGTIEAVRLDTGARKVLVRGGTNPQYLSPGHLVYARRNTMYAVAFDPATLEVHGDPQPIVSGVLIAGGGVGGGTGNGAAQFSIAANGTAAYLTGNFYQEAPQRLTVRDRTGKVVYDHPELKLFRDPRFSPNGKQIAVRVNDLRTEYLNILDPERKTLTRLTFEGDFAAFPVWSHDGKQLAFASSIGGSGVDAYIMNSDGTGAAKAITTGGSMTVPTSFSHDDQQLALVMASGQRQTDVVVVALADGKTTAFLDSPNIEILGRFSPDGNWMAYQMIDPAGNNEVYVRAYPDGSALRQVSSGGGAEPVWTKEGREIVYVANGAVFAVEVTPEGKALALGKPKELFKFPLAQTGQISTTFDVTADGNRFVGTVTETTASTPVRTHVTLVFNLFEEIRRAPAAARK